MNFDYYQVNSNEGTIKIAQALEVSIDFLVGNSSLIRKNTNVIKRLEDIKQLPEDDKLTAFKLLDAFIRDAKARKIYF